MIQKTLLSNTDLGFHSISHYIQCVKVSEMQALQPTCEIGKLEGRVSFLDTTYGLNLLVIYCDWRSPRIRSSFWWFYFRFFLIEVIPQSR